MLMIRTAIVVGVLSASTASAEIAFWFWTVSDTGDEDGFIEPGESALLSLWVEFEPQAVGVAETGPYIVAGDQTWAAGTVEEFRNHLDQTGFYGNGTLDEVTNTIADIHHFQLPPFYNDEFISHNPIKVYTIQWKPATYRIGSVMLTAEAPGVWIYTNDFGERAIYDGFGGGGTFFVAPAPATVAVFAFGVLGWARRRRLPIHPG